MQNQKKPQTCFLDTSALIPLLTPTHQNHPAIRQFLEKSKPSLRIDSVVLSEYLIGVSKEKRREALDDIRRQFVLVGLHPDTARVVADMFDCCAEHGLVPRKGEERQTIKADIFIVAAAILSKCDMILSYDKHIENIIHAVQGYLSGYEMPKCINIASMKTQGVLFDEAKR